jgi:hypothetical protein
MGTSHVFVVLFQVFGEAQETQLLPFQFVPEAHATLKDMSEKE